MKQLLFILTFTIILFISACESTLENDVLLTNEKNNINEAWVVKAYKNENEIFGPFTINTLISPNENSILITDHVFWGFQTKVPLLTDNGSFKTNLSLNKTSKVEAKIKILEGKLIHPDSIYFDIQFEDDKIPYGNTYTIKGSRKY